MAIEISNKSNSKNKLTLSNADREFVDLVNDRITLYGQIPYTVPEKLIVSMIKSSAKYFYKYYGSAWQTKYYYIKSKDIVQYLDDNPDDNFLTVDAANHFINIQIPLSPRIRIVQEVTETNQNNAGTQGQSFTGFVNPSISEQSTFGGDGAIGINNNLFIIETAVRMVETTVFNVIFKSKIGFDYNHNTAILVLKRKPSVGANIVLTVQADIDIHNMYNDSFFERHVIASCKGELKRLLGGHTIELPGGATMNPDEICAGADDKDKIEELIKAGSGVGDIIMKR